jgi:Holliday junction resolvase RusA-like endonuclease
MAEIRVVIPGEPVAQGRQRHRIVRTNTGREFVQNYQPAKSKNWKAVAAWLMAREMDSRPPFAGPVTLDVVAYFTCPHSQWRKRTPLGRRWHGKRPDFDNVGKAICDAAKGVLYLDDSQICDVRMRKIIAAQGEAPRVELTVRELREDELTKLPGSVDSDLEVGVIRTEKSA